MPALTSWNAFRALVCANMLMQANLPRVLNGLGIAILSTSSGIMSDKEARKLHVGGEVLCYIS
jgi:ribosomal protein S8